MTVIMGNWLGHTQHLFFFFNQEVNCHKRVSFDGSQKINAKSMMLFFSWKTLTKHGIG